jgi:hypothetical protein
MMEYLKVKVNELATHNYNEKIRHLLRGTNECKKGYHPVTNLAKNVNGDVLLNVMLGG